MKFPKTGFILLFKISQENEKIFYLVITFFYSKLRSEWVRLEETQKWISEDVTRIIIAQHTGVELANVIFTHRRYGLPSTIQANTETLFHLINLCTCCYKSICKLLYLQVDSRYEQLKVADIEMAEPKNF